MLIGVIHTYLAAGKVFLTVEIAKANAIRALVERLTFYNAYARMCVTLGHIIEFVQLFPSNVPVQDRRLHPTDGGEN